jgi:hypothetical protein
MSAHGGVSVVYRTIVVTFKIAWLAIASVILLAHAAVADESSYDKRMREGYKLPLGWFICNASIECGLIHIACGPSLAVNNTHRRDASVAICGSSDCERDIACAKSMPDTSVAACDGRQCVTVIK